VPKTLVKGGNLLTNSVARVTKTKELITAFLTRHPMVKKTLEYAGIAVSVELGISGIKTIYEYIQSKRFEEDLKK
jgi:hypothetical protein